MYHEKNNNRFPWHILKVLLIYHNRIITLKTDKHLLIVLEAQKFKIKVLAAEG